MRARLLISLPALSTLTLLLAACGSQPPAPEQNPAGVESRTPGAVKIEGTPVTTVRPDSFDPTSIAALKDPRSPLSKRSIYFDYDSYVVKDEFQTLLAAQIIKRLDRSRLTVRAAQQATGVPAADFSRIRHVDLDRFTSDRLITILNKMGAEVTVNLTVRKRRARKTASTK